MPHDEDPLDKEIIIEGSDEDAGAVAANNTVPSQNPLDSKDVVTHILTWLHAIAADGEIPAEFVLTTNEINFETMTAQDLINHIYSNDYKLREEIDKSDGLESRFGEMPSIAKKIWIRSGKVKKTIQNAKGETVPNTPQNNPGSNLHYIRIWGAYALAAIVIYQINNKNSSEGKKKEFLEAIHRTYESKKSIFYDHITSNANLTVLDESMEMAKTNLIENINAHFKLTGQKNYNDMSSLLDKTRHWVGLEGETEIVATQMDFSEEINFDNFTDAQLKTGLTGTPQEIEKKLTNLKTKIETYLKKGKFVILDQPCVKLTDEQKAQFSDERYKEQQWYKEFPDEQKKLFDYYIPRIVNDENFVIPSQLRALFPALKNAYKQSIFAIDKHGQEKELNSYFHCGTPAHVSNAAVKNREGTRRDGTAVNATLDNLKQERVNAEANFVVQISLNSELVDDLFSAAQGFCGFFNAEPPSSVQVRPDDSTAIRYIQSAVLQAGENGGIGASKICLNFARRVEKNDYSGTDQLVRFVTDNIKILADEDKDDILDAVRQYRELTSKKPSPQDKDVIGTEIIYLITKIAYLNNKFAERYGLKTVGVFFGCASGENRTSVIELSNTVRSCLDFLGIGINHPLAKPLILAIARYKHTANMKGGPGGDLGTPFARGKSEDSWPKSFGNEAKEQLFWSQFSDRKAESVLRYSRYPETRELFDRFDKSNLPEDIEPIVAKMKVFQDLQFNLNEKQREFLLKHIEEIAKEIKKAEGLPESSENRKNVIDSADRIVSAGESLLGGYNDRYNKISHLGSSNDELKRKYLNDQVVDTKAYEEKVYELPFSEKAKFAALVFAGGLLGGLIGCAIGMAVGTCFGTIPGTAIGGFLGFVKGASVGFAIASAACAAVGIASGAAMIYGYRPLLSSASENTGVDFARGIATVKVDAPRILR